jgi:hypothetical protein
MVGAARVRILATAVLMMTPTAALAQAGPVTPARGASSPPAARVRRNLLVVSGSLGYAVVINGSAPIDDASVWIRWTRRTRTRFAGGEPAWGFELVPLVRVSQEPTAYGAGGHFVYENRFLPDRRVRPVFRAGAGMLFTDHAVPVGETRYNFSLFAGSGLEFDFGSHTWLTLEYRFHHVSNADTGDRNIGINSHALGLGVGWSF